MKKKLVLLLVMLLSSLTSSFAVEVQIGGLWYDIDTNKKEATVIKYKNGIQYRGNIAIPSSVNYQGVTCRVTSIGSEAFENCSGLTSITIPNSVTSIGTEAFRYCSGLTSISIPNSVTSMKPFAFAVCTGLTSVTIPNSLKSISLGVFCKCSNLQSVTIPNSVEIIGLGAFENCPRLRSVTIPAKAEMVDNRAFDRSTIVRRAGENNSLGTASSKSTSTSSYTPTPSSSYTNPTPSSSLLYRGGFTGTGTKYIVGRGIVSYPMVSAYASIYTDRIEVTAGNSSRVLNFWKIENGNYFYGDNSYFWMFNPQSYALNEGTSDAVIMMGRTCSVCQGSLLCATCGGSGRVYDPSSRTGTSLCNTCGSSGRCWRCNGTGIF